MAQADEPHQAYKFLLKTQTPRLRFLFQSMHRVNEDQEFLILSKNRKLDKLAIKEERQFELQQQFVNISDKTRQRLLKLSPQLEQICMALQQLWAQKNVPIFHRHYFLKCAYSSPIGLLEGLLQKEMTLLVRGEHLLFKIERAIKARQTCILNLRKRLSEISESDMYEHLTLVRHERDQVQLKNYQKRYEGQGYHYVSEQQAKQGDIWKSKLQQFFSSLRHLHKLTVYNTQLILSWKQYIKSCTTDIRRKRENLIFRRNGDNYLLTMLNDNQFICNSFLASFYRFASKNDPFLMQPFLYHYALDQHKLEDQITIDLLLPEREDFVKIIKVFRHLSDQFEMHLKRRKYHDIFEKEVGVQPQRPVPNLRPKSRSLRFHSHQRIRYPDKVDNLTNSQKLNFVYHQLKALQEKYLGKQHEQQFNRQRDVSLQARRAKVKQFNRLVDNSKRKLPIEVNSKLQLLRQLKRNEQSKIERPPPEIKETVESQLRESSPHLKQSLMDEIKQYVLARAKEEVNSSMESMDQSRLSEPKEKTPPKQTSALCILPFKIEESKLKFTVEEIFFNLPTDYRSIFGLTQEELSLRLRAFPKFTILKLIREGRDSGYFFARLDKSEKERRKFVIEFLMTREIQQFLEALGECLNYLWSFELPDEIELTFLVESSNQPHNKLIQRLTPQLEKLGFMFARMKLTNLKEVKVLFKRPLTQRQSNNQFKHGAFQLDIQMVSSDNQVEFIQQVRDGLDLPFRMQCHYLTAQFLRSHLSYEELARLKDSEDDPEKVQALLELIIKLQKKGIRVKQVRNEKGQNFQELNEKAKEGKGRQYPMRDLVKSNRVHSTSISLNLSLTHQYNLAKLQDKKYFRLNLKSMIKVSNYDALPVYHLSTDNPKYRLILASAIPFLKTNKLTLHQYAVSIANTYSQAELTAVQRLWVPQCDFSEVKGSIFKGHFYGLQQFSSLGKVMLLRQSMSWCYQETSNSGVEWSVQPNDSILKPPLVVSVVNEQLWELPVYSRLVLESL